jgi:hypothetical protein
VERGALGETGPMVVSINGVVSSLAVTEFMVFATGMREPVPHLIYRGHAGTVGRNDDPSEMGCYFCTGTSSRALK